MLPPPQHCRACCVVQQHFPLILPPPAAPRCCNLLLVPAANLCVGVCVSVLQGLMVYDQHKYRQRYQEQVSQPLDPRTEISRRYRNRVPAI